eukprot:EG_transcript_1715
MAAHPLDGDGIAFNLFHFLKSRLDDKPLTFKVPDTIIFHNFPTTWYYWAHMPMPDETPTMAQEVAGDFVKSRKSLSKESRICGELREKAGKYLEKANIIQSFAKMQTHSSCDIIASFYQRDIDGSCSVEFMNAQELDTFLNSQHTGILQSFVMPRTDFNDMIQVVWSPKVCHVSRRTNRHKLYEKGPTRYEKALTYEGWSAYSEEDKIGPASQAKVQKVCQRVVEHLAGADHRYRISRMVLYMKEDRHQPDVVWLLYSTSFRIVEVRYREPTRVISFSPTYKAPPSQALRQHVEMPPELEEARVKAPPALVASRAVGRLVAELSDEDRDALGTAILEIFQADPALPSCVLNRAASPTLGNCSDGKKRRPPSKGGRRSVTPPPPSGRRSPAALADGRPLTSPDPKGPGQESEASLAKKVAARQAKRLRQRAASQRREAEAVMAAAARRHRATSGQPEADVAKGVYAGLVTQRQAHNEKLWRQVQAMQEAVDHLRSPTPPAPAPLQLKGSHRALPVVRGRTPPRSPSPASEQQWLGGRNSVLKVVDQEATPGVVALPFLNKLGGLDKSSAFATLASPRMPALGLSSPRGPVLGALNLSSPRTTKPPAATQQPLLLIKHVHASLAYKKVAQSIKIATDSLRRRHMKLVEEFEDEVDWATVGLTATSAQVHWPEVRTVYESISVPTVIHEVLEGEEGRGLVGTLLLPEEKFQNCQQAKRRSMNLAAFPAVNFVVNVSPPRDLWYGEELKKRKKRGSAEPEAKAAPLLEVGLPDLLGPPMQSPVSPSSTISAGDLQSHVDVSDTPNDSGEGYVPYCVSLPDKKMGLGTMDALKRFVRQAVIEADDEEERQLCEDLLAHMYATRKAGLLLPAVLQEGRRRLARQASEESDD